jgi:cell division septum initiation protein DivIVA
MTIDQLLDELDALLNEGARVPFTNKVVIEEDMLERVIDELRRTIPQEVAESRKILIERQAILEDAKKEAQHIMDQAKVYIAKLTDDSVITKMAQEQANEILHLARKTSKELQGEANSYAVDVLRQLEHNIERALEAVRQGRSNLQGGK